MLILIGLVHFGRAVNLKSQSVKPQHGTIAKLETLWQHFLLRSSSSRGKNINFLSKLPFSFDTTTAFRLKQWTRNCLFRFFFRCQEETFLKIPVQWTPLRQCRLQNCTLLLFRVILFSNDLSVERLSFDVTRTIEFARMLNACEGSLARIFFNTSGANTVNASHHKDCVFAKELFMTVADFLAPFR